MGIGVYATGRGGGGGERGGNRHLYATFHSPRPAVHVAIDAVNADAFHHLAVLALGLAARQPQLLKVDVGGVVDARLDARAGAPGGLEVGQLLGLDAIALRRAHLREQRAAELGLGEARRLAEMRIDIALDLVARFEDGDLDLLADEVDVDDIGESAVAASTPQRNPWPWPSSLSWTSVTTRAEREALIPPTRQRRQQRRPPSFAAFARWASLARRPHAAETRSRPWRRRSSPTRSRGGSE